MRILARDRGAGGGGGGGGGETNQPQLDAYATFNQFHKTPPPTPPPPPVSGPVGGEARSENKSPTNFSPIAAASTTKPAPAPPKLTVVRRFFERAATREALRAALIQRLKELSGMDPTVEVAREMADSLYILKLLGSSTETLEEGRKKASRGAMLLEGTQLVSHGQQLVRSSLAHLNSPSKL